MIPCAIAKNKTKEGRGKGIETKLTSVHLLSSWFLIFLVFIYKIEDIFKYLRVITFKIIIYKKGKYIVGTL